MNGRLVHGTYEGNQYIAMNFRNVKTKGIHLFDVFIKKGNDWIFINTYEVDKEMKVENVINILAERGLLNGNN